MPGVVGPNQSDLVQLALNQISTSMPLPYQYRDTPLTLFMAGVYFVAAIAWMFGQDDRFMQVTLAEACCSTTSCPVQTTLTSLPSVKDVKHDASAAGNVISMRAGLEVTPQQVWRALEAGGRRPLRIVIDDREFNSEPTW